MIVRRNAKLLLLILEIHSFRVLVETDLRGGKLSETCPAWNIPETSITYRRTDLLAHLRVLLLTSFGCGHRRVRRLPHSPRRRRTTASHFVLEHLQKKKTLSVAGERENTSKIESFKDLCVVAYSHSLLIFL